MTGDTYYAGAPLPGSPEGTFASTLSTVDERRPTTVDDVREDARRVGCTCTPEVTFLPLAEVNGVAVRHAQARHHPTCALLLFLMGDD